MSELVVSRLGAKITSLGYGTRVAAWSHGCSIQCPGCCAKDTWSGPGQRLPVRSIVDWWQRKQPSPAGLTISGGEPTEQAGAVTELIQAFRDAHRHADIDVLLFSGLPYSRLLRRFPELVAACDVICAGPYVAHLPSLPLRGSENQTLHLRTEIAKSRYGDVDRWPKNAMQAVFMRGRLVTVGIPDPAALAHLQSLDSLDPATASWTPPGELS